MSSDRDSLRDLLLGLGDKSMGKSYYPELQQRLAQLEQFRFLLDRSSDLVFLVECEHGTIKDVTGSAPRLLGQDRSALMGQPFVDIIGPPEVTAIFQGLFSRPSGFITLEAQFLPGTDAPLTVEVTANIVQTDDETFAVITARDITERKQQEAEVLSLRNYLTSVFDSMPSMIICVDAKGIVTHLNAATCQALDTQAKDAEGRPLGDVFPRLGGEMESVQDSLRNKETVVVTRRAYRHNGNHRYEDVTIYPLTGGIEGAVIRLDDVTNRVRMEEAMVQSEKMMSVGGLAAGMAHEINNPLSGILQGAQNILRRFSADLAANVKAAEEIGLPLDVLQDYLERRQIFDLLDGIRSSGERAALIVRNMLNFSRKSHSTRACCDINGLLDSSLEIASSDYDSKKRYDFRNIEIIKDYDPKATNVTCIPTELEQVFLNLFKNAAHAMAQNPAPTAPPRLTLRTKILPDKTLIEIADNGPGMIEDIRKCIFDPFFTTKGPDEGTGLGLSVSYFIITQNHDGDFSVESTPGYGARFIITFPHSHCDQ